MNLNKLGREIEATKDLDELITSSKELARFHLAGEGETRLSLTDGKTLLKIAKNEAALVHNKLEKFILTEVKDERVLRHLPTYYGRSANYYVLHIEYIKGPAVEWDDFWQHEDILGFQDLAIDQDLEGNVLWDDKRNTWVVIDLGMCWEPEHLPKIIPLLRANESIEDFAE